MTRIRENISKSVNTSSNGIQDAELTVARQLLGDKASTLSNSDLKEMATEIRFLVESWLDDFEKKAFNGKTLRELLQETE